MSVAEFAGKLPPIEPEQVGCLCCGRLVQHLSMRSRIAVGFGDAHVECDGEIVWSEGRKEWDECWTVMKAENLARKSPNRDWRIVLRAPLRGRVFQRHGRNDWVLIEEDEGFA